MCYKIKCAYNMKMYVLNISFKCKEKKVEISKLISRTK